MRMAPSPRFGLATTPVDIRQFPVLIEGARKARTRKPWTAGSLLQRARQDLEQYQVYLQLTAGRSEIGRTPQEVRSKHTLLDLFATRIFLLQQAIGTLERLVKRLY